MVIWIRPWIHGEASRENEGGRWRSKLVGGGGEGRDFIFKHVECGMGAKFFYRSVQEEKSSRVSFEDFLANRYLEGEANTPKVGCSRLNSMYILIF